MKHEAERPLTSTSEEKTEQAQQMILGNRHILTIDELAHSLLISHGSAQEIIHEILGYRKVSARWVPRQLTEEHKPRRVEICQTLLNYNNESEEFLSRMVTGDETWVHHYSPESKSKAWNGNIRTPL